ncbi:MAG: gliding motility-associated C-terminal domain-containing protein [Bacteroidales bacterium]|nr:gliding motility-associated C-terminal domain-containing protein [Bacteroidales bacterium]
MATPRVHIILITKFLLLFSIVFIIKTANAHPRHRHDTLTAQRIEFIENKGQWEKNILYKAPLNSGVLFAEHHTLTFVVLNDKQLDAFYSVKQHPESTPNGMIDASAYKVHFLGANPSSVEGNAPLESYNNYYIGKDSKKWRSNVKKYQSIIYKDIYEGIDLFFHQDEFHLKYEFVIAPHHSANVIEMKYEGVNGLSIQNQNLIVETDAARIIEMKPFAYQILENGDTALIDCHYLIEKQKVKYEIGQYNQNLPLIIDPVLIFSSYSGSTADNWGYSATFDKSGNLYSGGNVFALGYPTSVGAYQINYGGGSCDIAISKFDATGSFLHFSTYLGGNSTDIPHSLVVNDNDELYVLGTSGSSDFPTTPGAIDSVFHGGSYYLLTNVLTYQHGSDMVIAKFNSTGTALLGSTYLGGTKNDGLNTCAGLKKNYADEVRGEIIIDENSNVYVASSTQSTDFPTTGGVFSPTFNGGTQDGCVIKMNHNLTNIIWSTYLGGNGNDGAYSIVLSSDKSVYVCGGTNSTDLSVSNTCVQANFAGGTTDGYVAHISENGDQLQHCTYLGQSGYDQSYLIKNDRYDNPHIFGQTDAAGQVWVKNAQWFVNNGGQFLTKLTPSLDSIIWSTAFGRGNPGIDISPTALLVDLCNNIYMSGWGSPVTNSGMGGTAGLPITADAYQTTTDNNDYYFICISDDASQLVYATYFGSPNAKEHVDGGTSRFDNKGRIYQAVCAGCGGYDDFPTTPGAWSEENASANCNIGVIKFDFNLPAVIADFNVPNTVCAPIDLALNNTSQSISANTNFYWDFGDGSTSTEEFPTHHYTQSGVYTIRLVVQDYGSCNFSDTATRQIVVLGNSNTTLADVTICNGSFAQIGIPPSGESVTYQWVPSTNLNNATISNPVASPTTTTLYNLYVSNGVCIDTLTQIVHVENLTVTLPDTLHACPGESITLTPTVNGSANHYYWYANSPNSQPINSNYQQAQFNASPTQSTLYYIKACNSYCETWDSVWVEIIPFSVSSPAPFIACYGDTISIHANVSPTGNYQYQWSPAIYIVGNTTVEMPVVRPFDETIFTVVVTNEYGCTKTTDIEVQIKKLDAQEALQNVSCYEGTDGAISISPTGGTAPYFYTWSNGCSTSQMNNLTAGNYSVIITDALGCRTLDTFQITQPQPISIELISSESVECDQICDGSLTVSANGGNGGFQYLWLNGETGNTATQLCAGIYTVYATDTKGCKATSTFSLSDNSANTLQWTSQPPHCYHECDASISLTLDFNGEDYQVKWNNGSTSDTLTNLCAGVYSAEIDVVTGCHYTIFLDIQEKDPVTFANAFATPPTCHGDKDGALYLFGTGGAAPYQYAVNGVPSNSIIHNLVEGDYTIAVTDSNGCEYDTLIHITEPQELTANISASSPPCVEVCNATASIYPEGGTAPYHFLWDSGTTSSEESNLCVGTYTVKVVDVKGCEILSEITITDSSLFSQPIQAWIDKDTIYDGESISLGATFLDGFHYQWAPSGNVTAPHNANTTAFPPGSTTYIVTVSDDYGCTQKDSVKIFVIDVLCYEPYIFVPNAFSPNHDQKNDVLYVHGDFIETFVLKIYNRWGEEVFQTTELSKGWDGTYKGKDCTTDVYDYYLEVECVGHKKFFKKGNITLLR